MKITLVEKEKRTNIDFSDTHSRACHGHGALILPDGKVLDGFIFRFLQRKGAYIETDDPEKVINALGYEGEYDVRKV